MGFENRYSSGWRDLQAQFQRGLRKKRPLGRLPRTIIYTLCGVCGAAILLCLGIWAFRGLGHFGHPVPGERGPHEVYRGKIGGQGGSIDPKDLNLSSVPFTDRFVLGNNGSRLTVTSSLDLSLQRYCLKLLRHSRTLKAAVVALRPSDGKVLAMASYEKGKSAKNLSTNALFPAASLFKIVSAAAAMEKAGYTPDSPVYFVGGKHTLYRRQLTKGKGRYTRKTTLRRAFASSINPVFGKLGIYDLGAKAISEYAEKFLFNRTIPFDLPVVQSTVQVPRDLFGLAEVSSGFNRKTLISPLHAALLACVAANSGIIMVPRLIDRIEDESGKVLYESQPAMLSWAVSRGTSRGLRVLMRDTVLYGTCSKAFRSFRRRRRFRNVELGAKTGNVNDREDRFKYDWLTAYALPPDGSKAICIGVLAVHGEKLGLRANEIGRYIIQYHVKL